MLLHPDHFLEHLPPFLSLYLSACHHRHRPLTTNQPLLQKPTLMHTSNRGWHSVLSSPLNNLKNEQEPNLKSSIVNLFTRVQNSHIWQRNLLIPKAVRFKFVRDMSLDRFGNWLNWTQLPIQIIRHTLEGPK